MSSTNIPLADRETVERLLDYPSLVEAIRDAFMNAPTTPKRLAIPIPEIGEQPAGTVLVMPALRPAGLLGVKIITIHPALSSRSGGATRSTYIAFDVKTGELKGLIDGHALTLRRTAATSVLAARALARADAKTLLVIGTGSLALALANAYAETLRPREVLVWGRHLHKAEAAAKSLSKGGISARAVQGLRESVGSADIVSSATLSKEPLVLGADVRPGTHVDLVGAFTSEMRESDDHLLLHATVVADVQSTLEEAGDLSQPLQAGLIKRQDVRLLREVLTGEAPSRRSPSEITVFKSAGHALEDLAAADLLFKRWDI